MDAVCDGHADRIKLKLVISPTGTKALTPTLDIGSKQDLCSLVHVSIEKEGYWPRKLVDLDTVRIREMCGRGELSWIGEDGTLL